MPTLTPPKQQPLGRYLLLAVLLSILVAISRYHLISEDLEERTLETATPIVIALDEQRPDSAASPTPNKFGTPELVNPSLGEQQPNPTASFAPTEFGTIPPSQFVESW